eukprot:1005573-Prorocentrum_lima.AAC.1
MVACADLKGKDLPWKIVQSEATNVALAIKWHTSDHRWWRSPGKDKLPGVMNDIKNSPNIYP